MEAMAFSLSQFLGVVAGGDKDDPLLSGNMFPPVFPTPVVLRDLDEGDNVAVPLEGGHGDHPSLVLGIVAGGGEDGPLLSGDVNVAISHTPVVSWRRQRSSTSEWRPQRTSRSRPRRRC